MNVRNVRRGGVIAGVLLSIVAMVCLGVVAAIFIARNLRIESHDKPGGTADVSIDTPAGHLSVHAHDDHGALPSDIPVYPGARVRKDSGGGAVVEWSSNNGSDNGFSVSASEMITDDPLDKVADYYRTQLPNWVIKTQRDGEIHLELHRGGYKRVVAIREKQDGTHIGVASVGEPASN